MTRSKLLPLSIIFLLPTLAEARGSLDSNQRLDGVTILDRRGANTQTTAAGKLPAPSRDIPMSISVVDRNILERQGALRLDEALQNVPGIYQMGATGGYQQEIAGRGYAYSSSNTFKNGVRFNNSVMPEVTGLEKLEILKGSAAILYGNVAAGGILNLVTKKPQFASGGEVSFRTGSFDFYKPSIDVYGAVAGISWAAYRINSSFEKAGSFRDGVKSDRMYVNPSLLFHAGKKTDILIEGDYLKDNRTLDYGTGSVNYVVADIPRERFLGAEWSYAKLEQQSATITTTHRFNAAWQLRNITGIQDFSSDVFGTTRPNSGTFVQADGKWIRGIQRASVAERYYSSQLDLTGHVKTGKLAHTIVVGADWDAYRTATSAYTTPSKYDSVNIYDLNKYKQRADVPAAILKTVTYAPINRYGVYAQDLISVTKWLKVLAGVRYSRQETGSDVLTVANDSTASTSLSDGAATPRFGIVYQPTSALSFFVSYANSFTLNTGVDINGKALAPSFINQWEAGAKTELLKRILTANLSVYRIVNSNLAQTSLENGNTNANIKELAGEVTSEGVELELQTRSWAGLSLIGGYSYNETKYTASNTYITGSRLRYNPNHTGNLSLYYELPRCLVALRGFNVGAGWYYVGNRVAGRSTRINVNNDAYRLMELPDYSLFDASLGYTHEKLSVRLKLSNVANVLSYNVHDDNSVNPIAPRNWSATLSYKF